MFEKGTYGSEEADSMMAFCDILQRPDIYEAMLKEEMKRLGATATEISTLVNLEVVWAAIQNERHPKDVAWALLQ